LKINKILILIFILYVILLSFLSQGGFPKKINDPISFPFLSEKPITEDGYYALTVAWNIGKGKGITYNFSQSTTGFQPLYVFILSPLAFVVNFVGGSKIGFVRVVVLFSGILLLVFMWLIKNLTQSFLDIAFNRFHTTILILLVLFNYKIFLIFFNGLETGLYLILISGCIGFSFTLINMRGKWYHFPLFGFLLGLTTLARMDFILPICLLLLLLVYKKYLTIKQLSIIIISLIFTILPWFVYVHWVTESFLPSSVIVQSSSFNLNEFTYRIDQFIFSMLNPFVPFYYTGQKNTLLFYIGAIVILAALVKVYKNRKQKLFKESELDILLCWGFSFLLLMLLYFLFASVPFFFLRYLSPLFVITIPILLITIANYFEERNVNYKRTLIVIALLFFGVNVFVGLHYNKNGTSLAVRAGFIEDNFAQAKKIGIFQSGIAGYYFDNVINLDGKMNNNVLSYLRSQRLETYLDSMNINIMMEWRETFDILNKNYLYENWIVYPKAVTDNKSIVYVRKK
jgi:hypothetical protein